MDQINETTESLLMRNKKVPDLFFESFKAALSYFPELTDKYIFVHETSFKGIQHASRAYPPVLNLGAAKAKWICPVVINKNQGINDFFRHLSFEQQTGLLAHELSHVSSYLELSRLGMVIFSIKYAFSKKFVRRIEKETDLRAVERGSGKHLLMERIELFKFLRDNSHPDIEDVYIRPDELLDSLKKYPNLYSEDNLKECVDALELLKKETELFDYSPYIPFSRKIKHSLKIIFAFIPEFMEIFYVVVIKKKHLK